MPKGGSGFLKSAASNAGKLMETSEDWGKWRISDPSKYINEVQDLYKSMYRSGVSIARDKYGKAIEWKGSDDALDKAYKRITALAGRMSSDLELYNKEQDTEYRRLYNQYRSIKASDKDWKEFMRTKSYNEDVLIRRSRSSSASDAASIAEANNGVAMNNVNTMLKANSKLNQQRSLIWRSANSYEKEQGATDIAYHIMKRYERIEKAASKRRRS